MKLGKAFSDSIAIERSSKKISGRDIIGSWWVGAGRVLIFTSLLFIILFILCFRLFYLTIIKGHQYRGLADGNRTRDVIIHAPRGLLLDRTGKPLVQNDLIYKLTRPCSENVTKLCTEKITSEQAQAFDKNSIPEKWMLEKDYERSYLYQDALSHLLGYLGEINEIELGNPYFVNRQYLAGDKVGRMGAEAVFEEKLRGRNGKELVEIDATGKIIRTLGKDKELKGEDVQLSIDASLTKVAAEAFGVGKRGAIVVSKPSTGEILALYSSPSFNNGILSSGVSTDEYASLVDNPDKPLFNRAIGGVYPPGSTYKIITAVAGLEEGAITKDTIVEDNGTIKIGPFSFPNWYFLQYGKTEGSVDIIKAIQRSNDIFFYRTGEYLGISKLVKWSQQFGLGKPLGIELSGEAGGLMPDPAWKNIHFDTEQDRQARNNEWYLGDTYHVAIGQGYLLTTPLQVNAWTNVIANGGKLCKPTIEKVQSTKSKVQSCKDLGIKRETIDLVTEGMKKACEAGGTGWPLFEFKVKSTKYKVQSDQATASPSSSLNSVLLTPDSFVSVPVACKTGTAEFGDPDNQTHAWFTVFGPLPLDVVAKTGLSEGEKVISGEPEISVTVLVEGAGEGSSVAAPIAKKILEEWFNR